MLKKFLKSWIHEIFFRWESISCFSKLRDTQCGNNINSLSYNFDKNFVKATFLLKKLLKSWFHEIFFQWERKSCFSTLYVHTATVFVEKREIHCHANFFPSTQFIVKFFSEMLIWRNFYEKSVAVKFRNFHSAQCGNSGKFTLTHFWQIFRKSIVFTKEVSKELISRISFPVRENFSFFHSVQCVLPHCGVY